MSGKILVTDSLFIFDEHIKQFNDAGFEVERLDKPSASEDELVVALKDKVGYIVGGIERVTDSLLEKTDGLKVIGVTATAWDGFITGEDTAKQKGIMIANTPHANARAVAEWTFSSSLAMTRQLFSLGITGDATFKTTPGFSELNVGIVGLGSIGTELADLYQGVGVGSVSYWSKNKKETNVAYKELDDLLSESNIICVCVSGAAGKDFVDAEMLGKIGDGSIVTVLADITLNPEALLSELKKSRLRAFLDWTPSDEFKKLPRDVFYCSNESAAYNTHQANRIASDWITESMINLLKGDQDKHRVM